MLTTLRIQNFALIDQITIDFNKGFTVLTGETGSGKSILLGALNLILGERADYSVIGPNADKSIVEAEFDLSNYSLNDFFDQQDIDNDAITIIRREITSQGRSRAFINDTPVQLATLKEFTEQLIHIHSQHHTIELKKSDFQLELLDTLADTNKDKLNYSIIYKKWLDDLKQLNELKALLIKNEQQADYNQFQLDEIEELGVENYNFSELELELQKSESIDEIKIVLDHVSTVFDSDEGAISTISKLKSSFEKIKGKDVALDELLTRIQSVLIELKDIVNETDSIRDKVEVNPFRINELTIILDKYNRILKKHSLTDQAQLIALKKLLESEFSSSEELKDKIEELEKSSSILKNEVCSLADKMHDKRLKAKSKIEDSIQNLLEELKMPSSVIDFQLSKRNHVNHVGNTDVVVLFSPNKGLDPVSIEKAASGGELSRLMLVLQHLISKKKQLPTLIFDEIDTGVSGEVAQKIGSLLKKMGEHIQLLAISHLPQVAGKAESHFKVEKSIVDEVTRTKVTVLDKEQRVMEIARLMSGEQINDAALLNAKALMN